MTTPPTSTFSASSPLPQNQSPPSTMLYQPNPALFSDNYGSRVVVWDRVRCVKRVTSYYFVRAVTPNTTVVGPVHSILIPAMSTYRVLQRELDLSALALRPKTNPHVHDHLKKCYLSLRRH